MDTDLTKPLFGEVTPSDIARVYAAASDETYCHPASNDFEPHQWVLRAVHHAYIKGYEQGEARGQAHGQYVADQMNEQNISERTMLVNSTVAAILEAIDRAAVDGKSIIVTLRIADQRTIWDRVVLLRELNDAKTEITFSLRPKQATK